MTPKEIEDAGRSVADRHVMAHLWAQWLGNTPDPQDAFQRASSQSLDMIEGIYEQGQLGEQSHEITQSILHHAEEFWRTVGNYLSAMR